MKQDWHGENLALHWTLTPDEHDLLAHKTDATRLAFAVLLKTFQAEGRFPERPEDTAALIVAHLARQVDVLPERYAEVDWNSRTLGRHRAQILTYCGFHAFHLDDEGALVDWLCERVVSLDPNAEALKLAAYVHLRSARVEPPPPERLGRLLGAAVRQREERLCTDTYSLLPSTARDALDALIHTAGSEDEAGQVPLFPIKSDLANLKDDAGAVKVETVREEIAKLRQLRALNLPDTLFEGVPTRLVTQYRQRASSEPPRELRRHPPQVRATLLAALCWQRQREITDTLVELLIHIAHKIGVRAEEKVDEELLRHLKKVVGKTKLLYKLAKASKQHPNGVVKDVIYPAVGEQTIDDLVKEAEANTTYETRVRLVTRASYGHHYRRIVPALLEVLAFQSNNDVHRPVMRGLELLSWAERTA